MLALAVFLLLLWLGLYFCMSKRVKAKVDYSYKIHIPSSSRHTTFAFSSYSLTWIVVLGNRIGS
jgi:hypothetical protein